MESTPGCCGTQVDCATPHLGHGDGEVLRDREYAQYVEFFWYSIADRFGLADKNTTDSNTVDQYNYISISPCAFEAPRNFQPAHEA